MLRAAANEYELVAPGTLGGVLDLLADDPEGWTPLAGGTDVMVLLGAGKLPPGRFVSIWGLPELRGIAVDDDAVTIGALTTYAEVQADATCRAELPMLCQAARESGAAAIQNRGTLGGNIVNASPAADSPPPLLCHDAELLLVSRDGGERRVPYDGFHTGYKRMSMRPDELLRAIRIPRRPRPDPALHLFRKVGTRAAQAISKICFAALAEVREGKVAHVRLAMGSVAPTVVRCKAVEGEIAGRAIDDARIAAAVAALDDDIQPIDDVRSTRHYRERVARNLLEDFLVALAER